MRKLSFLVVAAVVLLGAWAGIAAAEKPAHEFSGAQKCSLCHKKESEGEQYRLWKETRHAKAWEALASADAKKVGASLGVDNPQTSPKCLKCHSTAYYFSEEKVTDAIEVQEGVSCESCHGAGDDYRKKSVMKNKAEAIAAGLMIPDETTCQKCHNPKSPTFKPFDYKERQKKIAHPIPKKSD